MDAGVAARCPECDGALEDYRPEAFEEEEEDYEEPTAAFSSAQLEALTAGPEADVAETATYQGLSAAVRARIDATPNAFDPARAPEPTTALRLSDVGFDPTRAPEPTTALRLSDVGFDPTFAPEPTTALRLSELEGEAALPPTAPQANPFGAPVEDAAPRRTQGYGAIPRPSTPTQHPEAGEHRSTRILDLNGDLPEVMPPTQLLQHAQPNPPAPAAAASQTPPAPARLSGGGLQARLSGEPASSAGGAPPLRRPRDAVKDPNRPTMMAMGPPLPQRPWALIVGGGLGALALVGGLLFWLLSSPKASVEAETPPPPPPPLSWEAQLVKQLESAAAALPVAEGTEPLLEGPYLAAGPEGLYTHFGAIPGLPSSLEPKGTQAADARGAWSRPVFQALSAQGAPAPLFALALDAQVPVEVALRMGYAAQRAGYEGLGLVVHRSDAAGKLGLLAFKVHDQAAPFPAQGALDLRVGRLGFNVSVRDGQRQRISQGEPRIKRREKGDRLDFFALEKRLAALGEAHPKINQVVFFPLPKMTLEEITQILSLLALSRFNQVWIQPPEQHG
ncbi:hypothetical protein KKF91_20260 [Myxococcota bacterium]|nr:hypothetical protein [Myxococcota bacterium]